MPPAEIQAEKDRQDDVGAVDEALQQQADQALTASEHEAEDGIVGQPGRRRHDTDGEIDLRRLAHRRTGRHGPDSNGKDYRRQEQQDPTARKADEERTPVDGLLFGLVTTPECLRNQAGRRGAQEIEGGEDQIEQDGADGQAADQRRIAQPADNRHVHQAQQRRGQIGKRHRNGDRQDQAVRHRKGSRAGRGRRLGFGKIGVRHGAGPVPRSRFGLCGRSD